ncbi:hypothetical protein QUB80_32740 [Chlorogloeopsis sp. ULAP01]|uniref:DUF6875 domain-containing protein n=1 Tax=Chlorogloeopsis sp. ULAP01 TaxID=3056483 RepID=UPI0025AB0C6D|nr:hypothetical protein [Chlorogloeopsis sp. ULAP01]MDM9385423.1 hypothetical protein [Chlorogloeopsis sp. ULAP01]
MQLYTPLEIDNIQQDIPYLLEVMEWVKTFLAKPHPDLGRPGVVCPFVPHSLKSNSIRLAVIRAKNLQPQQVEDIVKNYRDTFLEIEPQDREAGINKAFLLIFPDLDLDDAATLIDSIQQKLKPFFVEEGLMIGEFHKHTETRGLHNQDFYPLRSPVPLIAIRFMVEADLPFLMNANNLHLRIKYLEAYLQRFEKKMKDKIRLNTAYQALALAREKLVTENSTNLISEKQIKMNFSCPFLHQH